MSGVPLTLTVATEHWPLKTPLRITGYTVTGLDTLVVTLDDGACRGRGEAAGVYYLGDDLAAMTAAVESVRDRVEAGLDRKVLRQLLPAGGARNAVDCALWDLEAKRAARPVWSLAGLRPPRRLLTTFTLGADDPQEMAAGARAFSGARALKLKLIGEAADASRVRAVRAARPDVWIGVDANQGFTPQSLAALMPALAEAGVGLIEQPFPRDRDHWLDALDSPIPVAADESVQSHCDIARLVGRVEVINIKLDKCGGLTEGLAMVRKARRLGLRVMVGNMLGTTLAMAPAYVLGQLSDIVDLDGPMLLASDREPAILHQAGMIECPPEAWGGPGD